MERHVVQTKGRIRPLRNTNKQLFFLFCRTPTCPLVFHAAFQSLPHPIGKYRSRVSLAEGQTPTAPCPRVWPTAPARRRGIIMRASAATAPSETTRWVFTTEETALVSLAFVFRRLARRKPEKEQTTARPHRHPIPYAGSVYKTGTVSRQYLVWEAPAFREHLVGAKLGVRPLMALLWRGGCCLQTPKNPSGAAVAFCLLAVCFLGSVCLRCMVWAPGSTASKKMVYQQALFVPVFPERYSYQSLTPPKRTAAFRDKLAVPGTRLFSRKASAEVTSIFFFRNARGSAYHERAYRFLRE